MSAGSPKAVSWSPQEDSVLGEGFVLHGWGSAALLVQLQNLVCVDGYNSTRKWVVKIRFVMYVMQMGILLFYALMYVYLNSLQPLKSLLERAQKFMLNVSISYANAYIFLGGKKKHIPNGKKNCMACQRDFWSNSVLLNMWFLLGTCVTFSL